MQRQPPLQVPFRARDFVAIQAAADAHLDSLATEAQRRIHRFPHSAAEAHALLQLQSDVFGHQLRIQLWLVHLLDVHIDIAVGALLDLLLELVNLRALAADDDARTCSADDDAQLVARTLDLDRADARRLELFFQLALQLDVFQEQFVVVTLHEPARPPRLGDAEAESVRMDFLSHSLVSSPRRLRWAAPLSSRRIRGE